MENSKIIENAVKKLKSDIKVIEFSRTKLSGEVDFSFLKKFVQLKKVIIKYNKNLTEIFGLPDSIEKLECCDNNLKSLNKLPFGLKILYCRHNDNLENLDNLPKSLKILNCSTNNIKLLDNLPDGLVCLFCAENKITKLENLPESLEVLDCSYNHVTNLSNLPTKLKILHCNTNRLGNLTNLPISLTDLSCIECNLTSINLPNNLIHLSASHNEIKILDSFPPTIKYIDLACNLKIKIFNLPSSLLDLELDECELTELPVLNDGIRYCDVSSNLISSIDGSQLPQTLLDFMCRNNKFTQICNLTEQTLESIICGDDDVKLILVSGEEVQLNNEYDGHLDSDSNASSDNNDLNYVKSKYQKLFYESENDLEDNLEDDLEDDSENDSEHHSENDSEHNSEDESDLEDYDDYR